MQNRTPVPRDQRPALPDFAPVPRKCQRHDGWTPERQRAFIEALADTGCVTRAAAMVNMSPEGAYYLRRQKGADQFRRAWEAALDYGVARMKDIAFERAITGYLVPCFVGGKLLGWRRKYNDRLLMFCLRHYGEDANGRRTKVEYFSTRATAGASAAPSAATPMRSIAGAARRDAGPDRPTTAEGVSIDGADSLRAGTALSLAEARHTTVRTVVTGKGSAPNLDATTALIEDFPGIDLDETAQAEIYRVLQDCAARRRAVEGTPDDPNEPFISVQQEEREELVYHPGYARPTRERRRPRPLTDVVVEAEAFLERSPEMRLDEDEQFRSGAQELPWEMLDDVAEIARIEEAVASVKRAKLGAPPPTPPLPIAGEGVGAADTGEGERTPQRKLR